VGWKHRDEGSQENAGARAYQRTTHALAPAALEQGNTSRHRDVPEEDQRSHDLERLVGLISLLSSSLVQGTGGFGHRLLGR
jgi:hypothetical protein